MNEPHRLRRALQLVLVLASVCLVSCGDETTQPKKPDYLPQTSPANVLNNLQVAYRQRNVEEYAKLLANDFQFYFDATTRESRGLPEFWTRLQDSTATGGLFAASEVADIRIALTARTPKPVDEVGRDRWQLVDVLDTFLEVDLTVSQYRPEGLTLRVDGQLQKFYFRTGKTLDDTTSGSPTKDTVYLVEWRDRGFGAALMKAGGLAGGLKPETENNTWSRIKTLFK